MDQGNIFMGAGGTTVSGIRNSGKKDVVNVTSSDVLDKKVCSLRHRSLKSQG